MGYVHQKNKISCCFYFLNRALEEKQKAEEEKELRFREQILKQRKLKLQEATEKFQRAHLPFSQRRRTGLEIHRSM